MHFLEVKKILRKYFPHESIWFFGSRVTGNARQYSDLDVLIKVDDLSNYDLGVTLFKLQDEFSESNIPFKVDIVLWKNTTPEFRELILSHAVMLEDVEVIS